MLGTDEEGKVLSFSEKPVVNDWVSAGFFVFNRKVFDYLKVMIVSWSMEPLQRLAREGELMAYKHDGFFFSMDTYRDYKYINDMCDRGETPWIK